MNDDAAFNTYAQVRSSHWDQIARSSGERMDGSGYYHRRLAQVYSFLVPPGERILEVGCGQGDLLAALKPAHGCGVDFSAEMLERARQKYPDMEFIPADAHNMQLDGCYDFIIISDLVNDVWDIQRILEQIRPLCKPQTRLIFNWYSRMWELPLKLAQAIRIAKPMLFQNWLTVDDLKSLLRLAGFEAIHDWEEILLPIRIPLIDDICNRFLVKMIPFSWLALTNFLVARPTTALRLQKEQPSVSVIVPARNEAGNITSIIARTPDMGSGTEIVFIEGHSHDATYETIQGAIRESPQRRCKLFRQLGIGKGDAVRLGFMEASGDVLMVLDADLTVPPEDLPRFYEALVSGKGEFINGVRLVYPMEKEAMRFLNFLGNKFFSLAFSWLLAQPVKDTLCGTKVLWKADYERIAANRAYFGDFDPFGDFDLLFGASKLNLKILDLPIRYRDRTYGTTNIERWKHGWLLLKMVAFAASRIKFV
jgi:SAM-dependent methyltransferase